MKLIKITMTLVTLFTAKMVLASDYKPMKVEIDFYNKVSRENAEKFEYAASILQEVVNSKAFYERVVNFKHKITGKQEFQDNDGLTNEQVFEKINAAVERYNTEANNTINLRLSTYMKLNPWSSTIASTTPASQYINVSRSFLKYASASDVIGNMMHEWLHKAGFDHSFEWNENRDSSVPYAIGYIACELAAQYTAQLCTH